MLGLALTVDLERAAGFDAGPPPHTHTHQALANLVFGCNALRDVLFAGFGRGHVANWSAESQRFGERGSLEPLADVLDM